jgi:hypothetical protein
LRWTQLINGRNYGEHVTPLPAGDGQGGVQNTIIRSPIYMSQTWTSAVVLLLAQLLPFLGVEIANEQLTTTISTLITIGSGLWIIIRGYMTGHFSLGGRRLPR